MKGIVAVSASITLLSMPSSLPGSGEGGMQDQSAALGEAQRAFLTEASFYSSQI